MNELVTIPREDYDRLVAAAEDLADLRAVEAFRAAGQDGVPAEFVKRMLNGESLLKLWREHRGISQSELARLSGVNRVQIGDIEDRGKSGSVSTLKKLAQALAIRIDDLLP